MKSYRMICSFQKLIPRLSNIDITIIHLPISFTSSKELWWFFYRNSVWCLAVQDVDYQFVVAMIILLISALNIIV